IATGHGIPPVPHASVSRASANLGFLHAKTPHREERLRPRGSDAARVTVIVGPGLRRPDMGGLLRLARPVNCAMSAVGAGIGGIVAVGPEAWGEIAGPLLFAAGAAAALTP